MLSSGFTHFIEVLGKLACKEILQWKKSSEPYGTVCNYLSCLPFHKWQP